MRPSEIAHAHASTCTRCGQPARGSPVQHAVVPRSQCGYARARNTRDPRAGRQQALCCLALLCQDGGPGAMTAMAAVSRVLTAATLRVCPPLLPASAGNDAKKASCVQRTAGSRVAATATQILRRACQDGNTTQPSMPET